MTWWAGCLFYLIRWCPVAIGFSVETGVILVELCAIWEISSTSFIDDLRLMRLLSKGLMERNLRGWRFLCLFVLVAFILHFHRNASIARMLRLIFMICWKFSLNVTSEFFGGFLFHLWLHICTAPWQYIAQPFKAYSRFCIIVFK